MFVIAACVSISFAGYVDWQNEYDGKSANTLYLWNFNAGEILADKAVNVVTGGNPKATRYGNASFVAGGKFGGGAHLPGGTASGDFLYPYAAITNTFSGAIDPSFTIETWANFDNIGQQTQWIVDKQYTNKDGFQLRYYNDSFGKRFVFSIGNGTTLLDVWGLVPDIEAGQWYHVAATWDAASDTAKIFVNGDELASVTSAGFSYLENAKYIKIGNRQGSGYGVFAGTLDGFRISNVAYDFVPEPATVLLLSIGLPALLKRKNLSR
jgi:hypothetical protein